MFCRIGHLRRAWSCVGAQGAHRRRSWGVGRMGSADPERACVGRV